MNTKLLLIFIALNIVNVIIQTVKSLATVKCGKTVAALVNAVAYGLYTVVVIYMVCELPLAIKVAVIATCNLVGVYAVKYAEEKMRRDKLWEIRFSLATEAENKAHELLESCGVSHNFYHVSNGYTVFNAYCATQAESTAVKEILKKFNAKYFVTESRSL